MCFLFTISDQDGGTEIDWKLELMDLWEGTGEKMNYFQFDLNPVEPWIVKKNKKGSKNKYIFLLYPYLCIYRYITTSSWNTVYLELP